MVLLFCWVNTVENQYYFIIGIYMHKCPLVQLECKPDTLNLELPRGELEQSAEESRVTGTVESETEPTRAE